MSLNIKILIVDDHVIVREGLKRILSKCDDINVISEAGNCFEAIRLIQQNKYSIIILDISMPGKSGLELLTEIKSINPTQKVLILSMHSENIYAKRTLLAGASGYMTKESAPNDLVDAIYKIHKGGKYISPSLAEILVDTIGNSQKIPPHETLSNREYQVFEMIAVGKKIVEIANELHLSSKTISTYRSRIINKMKLSSNTELTKYAIANKLISM
tara:strand:+ start:6227 stop:6871 length:645 start_codon:yes stop_codon:yes gene_type:complete